MRFETYLVESINRMNSLLVKSNANPEQSRDCLLEAAIIGCRTLKQLTGDNTFHSTVEEVADVRIIKSFLEKTSREYERRERERVTEFMTIIDSDHFDAFLDLEREIMIRGGLDEDVVDLMIQFSRDAIAEVRERAKPPSEVLDLIRLVRDRACLLSDDLIKQAQDEGRWDEIKDKIKKAMLGIGGATLIGLNASALAASIGLTAAGSAVSAALGASIIGAATADTAKTRGAGA